jgi:hypothetical protein
MLAASTSMADYPVRQSISEQQQMMAFTADLSGTDATAGAGTGQGKQWIINVPDYKDDVGVNTEDSEDTYLRLGRAATWETEAASASTSKAVKEGWGKDGWLDYTDGDHRSYAKGDRHIKTDGYFWEQSDKYFSYARNARHSYSITAANNHSIGVSTSSFAGANFSTSFGIDVAMKTGISVTFSNSRTYSYTKGMTFAKSSESETEASKHVRMKVNPVYVGIASDFLTKMMPDIAFAVAAASSVTTAIIATKGFNASGFGEDKAKARDKVNAAAEVHAGVLAAGGATLLAGTLLSNGALLGGKGKGIGRTKDEKADKPASDFFMDENSAMLKVTGNTEAAAKERVVKIQAGNSHSDNELASLYLNKHSDGAAGAKLNSGGTKFGEIELTGGDKGKIVLKVGTSSIEIEDEKMVFKADEFEFIHTDGGTLSIKKGPGMVLTKGGFVVKDGSVKASKVAKGEDIKGKKCTIGGLKVT